MKKQCVFICTISIIVAATLPVSAALFAPTELWQSLGLSGGGGIFNPTVSGIDPNLMIVSSDMSGVYMSHDGGLSWKMILHSELWSSTSCRAGFHPQNIDIIYAARGNTLRKSSDRGKTWEHLADLGATLEGQIAIDPDDPNLMLVGAAGSVRRSTDAGQTWSLVIGPSGKVFGFHFDMTSPVGSRVCFVGTENGIWRSDDRGQNWAKKTNGLPWEVIQSFAGGSNNGTGTVIIYCSIESRDIGGFQGGVYKSADRGENWVWAMAPDINMDTQAYDQYAMGEIAQYYHLKTTNVAPSIVYTYNSSTGFSPPHHPTVYRSTNAGGSWTAVFYQDPRWAQYNCEYHYHSAYLGQTWQSVPNSATIAASDPNRLLHTDNEMCYITHDGGATWFNGQTRPVPGSPTPPTDFLNTGLVVTSAWHYYIDPFDPNRHYIPYTDIGFARSVDAGEVWKWGFTEIPWSNTTYELAFDPDTPGKMWGAFSNTHDIPRSNTIRRDVTLGSGGIGVSYDYGATWAESNTGIPEVPACSVIVDPTSGVGNRTLYAAIFSGGVYKSTDDGATWTQKSNGLGSPSNMRAYRIVRHNDGTLFCVVTAKYDFGASAFDTTGQGLYKSTDAAENWTRINSSLVWPTDLTVDPADSNIIYLGAFDADNSQGGLWRTINGGGAWTRIAREGKEHFGAYLHPSRPGWIYMTLGDWNAPTIASLWLSKDNGDTWQPFEKFPFNKPQRVTFIPGEDEIYVGTWGGSAFKGPEEPYTESVWNELAVFVTKWLEQDCNPSNYYCDGTDLNLSSDVDFEDYAILAQHWFEQAQIDPLLEGLVARYNFNDDTANDSSGNDHHGTLEDGATIVDDPGGNGKSVSKVLSVDDYPQHVDCGGGGGGTWADITGELTLSAWMKPVGFVGRFGTIVSKGGGEVEEGGYSLCKYRDVDELTFVCMSIPDWQGLPTNDPDIWDGNWHHIAATYFPGAVAKIYVDGALSNTDTKGYTLINTNSLPVIIGGNAEHLDDGNNYWSGLIDDARIYDRALSADEIALLVTLD